MKAKLCFDYLVCINLKLVWNSLAVPSVLYHVSKDGASKVCGAFDDKLD